MRDVLSELLGWWRAGETVGVGTVVATFQSAPRPAGASMLVGPDGTAVGSVSGGCVEGAVYDLAQSVVAAGVPVLQRYGVSDDDAFAVGLTCGGILDVWVEKVNRETFPELEEIAADIEAGRPVALATVIEHPDPAWLGRRLVVRPDGGVLPDVRALWERSQGARTSGSTFPAAQARGREAVHELAGGDGGGAGGDHVVVPIRRHVVVVAVEAPGGDADRRGEGVQLVVGAVTGQVRPQPAVPGGVRRVDEDHPAVRVARSRSCRTC